MWNLFQRISEDLPTTNNSVEGFHSAYALSTSRRPNIWQSIKSFMREDGLASQKHFDERTWQNAEHHVGRSRKIEAKRMFLKEKLVITYKAKILMTT